MGSEVEYSKDSDSGSEYSTAQSDADSEATEDVEVVGEERAASDAYNTALSSLSPLQGVDMQPSAAPSTTDAAGKRGVTLVRPPPALFFLRSASPPVISASCCVASAYHAVGAIELMHGIPASVVIGNMCFFCIT